MSLGAILGQMMQQGGSGGGARLNDVLRNFGGTSGAGTGGGFGGMLTQLQGALGGGAARTTGAGEAGIGGMAERARDFFGKEQAGGLNTGQIGGIGAIAGALLGGGAGGAAKGGAMAILGTLAIGALRAAQANAGQGGAATASEAAPPSASEISDVTGPDAERLMLLAMISAAKADGNVDEDEMNKIIGKAGENDVTEEERQLIMTEINAPIDIPALAARASTPTQAAAVYAASLMAIKADTPAEKAYLAQLAGALRLDPAAVTALERTAGL